MYTRGGGSAARIFPPGNLGREFEFPATLVNLLKLLSQRSGTLRAMPQLLVRQIEEKVVRRLKEQAGKHGVSMEEEHRRILREALLGKTGKEPSFKEFLKSMPDAGPDELFARDPDVGREVKL